MTFAWGSCSLLQFLLPRPQSQVTPEEGLAERHWRYSRSVPLDDEWPSQEAVKLAKRGDRDALRYLYVTYARDVRQRIQGIVHDAHEAEDLTHDVFVKLYTAIGTYERREVPFSAWILRVAQNAALDHLKRRRQVPFAEMQLSDCGRDQLVWDRRRCLTTAFAGLTHEQREVLVLHHLADLSLREIADRMGKSEGAVTQLHHRGRASLRASLAELDSAPRTQHAATAD
jgi:RNA polymerase sigma-70 factor, ECF subfamily